ncbi:hypothetical protein [Ruminococcus sp.]
MKLVTPLSEKNKGNTAQSPAGDASYAQALCGVAVYKHALLYRISVLLSSFAKIPAEAAGKKVACSQKNAIDEYPDLLYNIK